MTNSDDATLLGAWAEGDNAAGERLLARYFDRLLVFFGPRAEHEAEDLVQRTLMSCVQARESVHRASSFRAFVFTTAKNQLVDHYRRTKPTAQLPDLDDEPSERTTPSQFAIDRERRRELARAIHSLDTDLQIALALHFWEGMTNAELAEVLEIPLGTVKSRVRRAKEALHARLLASGTPSHADETLESLGVWASRIRAGVSR